MSAQNQELVQYSVKDQIATITLNRPEKLNAFSDDSVVSLLNVMRRFDIDEDARVAVIVGAGRAFSSGADVQQRQLRSKEEFAKHGGPQGWGAQATDVLTRSVNWKPVIAAAHGFAIGMGLGLVLECDLIVAAAGTKFQVTETPRGLAAAKYWALMNYRGNGTFATRMTLTGRFFTAEEAFAAQIIDEVAPEGQHLERAYALAAEINQHPPLGVRASVRVRRWYLDQVEREAYSHTNPLKLHLTDDVKESATAFVEKRKGGPYHGR